MSSKRLFRLAYHASRTRNKRFRIHQLRDADAFSELAAVLYSRGYSYGGLLLNLPPKDPKNPPTVDLSHLSSSDLLVLNTRPPIHDIDEEVNRPVGKSDTSLEREVFAAMGPYLKKCSRSHILMTKPMADRLPAEFRNRANIMFRQNIDGSYIEYRGYGDRYWQKPAVQGVTACYKIQIPHLWPGGPGLLAAFGMAGTETLAWNYLLRTRFPDWIGSDEFLMAEVTPGRVPEEPADLSFADDWEVKLILRAPLAQISGE